MWVVCHRTIMGIWTQHPNAFMVISQNFTFISPSIWRLCTVCILYWPTGENKTLDILYEKVKETSGASTISPLGRPDHNLVFSQQSFKWTAAITGKAMVDCITDNIHFCWDTVIPVRTECCFPNEHWICSNNKDAFRDGHREKLKSVQQELN